MIANGVAPTRPSSPTASVPVSIIIVNWNTRDLLRACLRSVFATPNSERFEVIVFDNASTDGSAAMISAEFPQVTLIDSPDNVGFAGGNNRAFEQARGDALLLLNPDTEVAPDAIPALLRVLDLAPDVGIVGANLFNPDGSPQRATGVFPNLWTELPGTNRHSAEATSRAIATSNGPLTIELVDWVSGACLLIRRSVFEAIGGLDEDYWLYTEEVDWCFRARQMGWQVASLPDAHVMHVARAASRQQLAKTMIDFYNSRLTFLRKHHGRGAAAIVRGIVTAKAALWSRWPAISPIAREMGDVADVDMRDAYAELARWGLGRDTRNSMTTTTNFYQAHCEAELAKGYWNPAFSMWRAYELEAFDTVEFIEPILDLGCGDGTFGELMLQDKKAIGIDLGWGDLHKNHSDRYIATYQADASKLPFPDASFNTIVSNSSVEHMANLTGVLSEVSRLLKPGGVFTITVPNSQYGDYLFSVTMLNKLGRTTSAEAYAARKNNKSQHLNLHMPEEWAQLLGNVGLTLERAEFILPREALALWEMPHTFFGFLKPVVQPMTREGSRMGWVRKPLTAISNQTFGRAYRRLRDDEDGANLLLVARK